MSEIFYQIINNNVPCAILENGNITEKSIAFLELEKKLDKEKITALLEGNSVFSKNKIYVSEKIESDNISLIFVSEKNFSELPDDDIFISMKMLKSIENILEATENSRNHLVESVYGKDTEIKKSIEVSEMGYMEIYAKSLISDVLLKIYDGSYYSGMCDMSDTAESIYDSINKKLSGSGTKVTASCKKNCTVGINCEAVRVLSAIITRNLLTSGTAVTGVLIGTFTQGNKVYYKLEFVFDTFVEHKYKCFFDTKDLLIYYDDVVMRIMKAMKIVFNVQSTYEKSEDKASLVMEFDKVSPLVCGTDSDYLGDYLNHIPEENDFDKKYSPENVILYSVVKREMPKNENGEKTLPPFNISF